MKAADTILTLENTNASLHIDRQGGAITRFSLKQDPVNPLSFNARQDPGTESEASFKGHFLCLGRWGDPSEGESRAGIPKHGDFSRINWNAYRQENTLYMQATSSLEGLTLNRIVSVDPEQACFKVTESVKNFHALGRIYNMVQHPTIAAPFLTARTLVDCSATRGFDYTVDHYHEKTISSWPSVKTSQGIAIDLRSPRTVYSSVYPFISDPAQDWGWITVWSPEHHLLFGYAWPRAHYPWINLWLHYAEDKLVYRGLEFGTTGVHKPFREILDERLTHLLDEKTYSYLDAGEEVSREYLCFLQKMPLGFKGTERIMVGEKRLSIIEKETAQAIYLPHSFNLNYGI